MDKILKALADPVRLDLLKALCCEPLTVGDLVKRSRLSQPAISHHLRILKEAALVDTAKEGTRVYYSLRKSCIKGVCCGLREEFKL